MKKKQTKKEKKNQVIEIHIYVHQSNSNGASGIGQYTYQTMPNNPPNIVLC